MRIVSVTATPDCFPPTAQRPVWFASLTTSFLGVLLGRQVGDHWPLPYRCRGRGAHRPQPPPPPRRRKKSASAQSPASVGATCPPRHDGPQRARVAIGLVEITPSTSPPKKFFLNLSLHFLECEAKLLWTVESDEIHTTSPHFRWLEIKFGLVNLTKMQGTLRDDLSNDFWVCRKMDENDPSLSFEIVS